MNTASKIEARAAEWIAERDRDAWSHQRQRDLDAWLDESVAHRVAYLRLHAAWQRADRLRALRSAESSARSSRVVTSVRTGPGARGPRGLVAWGFRAVAGSAVLGVAILLSGKLSPLGSAQVYATPLGARESVSLEDGSKLTLNTSTQLRAKIDRHERIVWLDDGEAYFDVAHDAARPFVIVAGSRRVTVVGTKFSLRREGDRLKVDVVEGRVRVHSSSSASSPLTLLSRGETAISEGSNVLVSRRTERQSLAATSWLDGRLVFDQMTIADAAAQFNRYNRKKLVITDPAAANVRIGGTFEAGNVEGFARLMQAGFGLLVESHDDRIVMSSAAR